MNYYLALLRFFISDRTNWEKFQYSLDNNYLKANYPELHILLQVITHLYLTDDRSSIPIGDLELGLLSLYPRSSITLYKPLLDGIRDNDVSSQSLVDHIRVVRTREHAANLARKALAVSDGHEPPEVLSQAIQTYESDTLAAHEAASTEADEFTNDDLQSLIEAQLQGGGLEWRLSSLNKSLGPLRKGDFGFVFARPETGKTTFLASELSHMAGQTVTDMDGPILWFNNEEQGQKVLLRVYQAALDITQSELMRDVPARQRDYLRATGGNLKLIDDAGVTARKVERLCQNHRPRLVVFDQIDKIRGFQSDRTDLELAGIYRWAREIAKKFCPVIGISQAGASGDGRKWLTMNDVDNSKTGKQAEADWILGIGKTYDSGLESVRYLHLSKNKLTGGLMSDPAMRHGKWEVKILPEKARYADFN